ncbi:MAG: hypothetical protein RR822_02660, partial [Raoultibacter sp.]
KITDAVHCFGGNFFRINMSMDINNGHGSLPSHEMNAQIVVTFSLILLSHTHAPTVKTVGA